MKFDVCVTRLADFFKVFGISFLTNVGIISSDLLGYFEKHEFYVK